MSDVPSSPVRDCLPRRLAAILAADVAGYSRLSAEDEEGTIAALHARRRIFDDLIARHGGRIANTAGDSVIAEFASPVHAIHAAMETQSAVAELNRGIPEDKAVSFRIGINLGDVIDHDGDLLGDGVNIAARIEQACPVGEVCVSGEIRQLAEGRVVFRFEDRGTPPMKNIRRSVKVFRVLHEKSRPIPLDAASKPKSRRFQAIALSFLVAVAAVLGFRYFSTTDNDPRSTVPAVAVLPFAADADSTYLGDGIAQDILTQLTRLPGLQVVARDSTIKYRGESADDTAKGLGVRYILQGTVSRSPVGLRISSRLTDTSTRRELWAQNYDIVAGDLFRLQDELVQQIVVATSAQVTRTELERIRRKPTTDLTAYDLFLKGRDLRWRYDRESNVASRKLLEQAVEADPRFAEARVELGRSWLTGSNLAWDGPEALEQARDQAAQAIALDGTLSSAHALLARTLIRWRQFDEAIQSARRAVELNSSDAESLQLVAEVLTFAGQPGEALTLINRAMLLNPHYPPIYAMVAGRAALMAGDLTQAASLLRQCATRAPSIWPCRAFLAVALERSGKHQEARLDVNEYLRIAPGTTAGKLQQRLSFRNDVDVLIILDALKSAGLPE